MIKCKRLNKELFHNIQTEVLDSSFDKIGVDSSFDKIGVDSSFNKIGEAWLIR